MIVTCHQPNYLPGLSVIEKVRSSHAVIWLDEVQYSHDGWSNRNRMPDGSWLTVPVDRDTDMAAFNRVRVSEHDNWRVNHAKTLSRHYGFAAAPICEEILRPYRLLVGLNLACLRVLLERCPAAWHFQSHLDGGRPLPIVSDDAADLTDISGRLAAMVAEIGGTTYLSGQSGRNYLDERPFHARGIHVAYFDWPGPNPCALERLAAERTP